MESKLLILIETLLPGVNLGKKATTDDGSTTDDGPSFITVMFSLLYTVL
jgi:hypothetical protein